MIAEIVIENAAQAVGAQQRGVALDERVQPALLHEVGRNALDLLRRAAMHRRKGDVVRQAARDFEPMGIGVVAFKAFEQAFHVRAGVLGPVEKPLHVRLANAFEVIADAQVEHDIGRLTGETEFSMQRVNKHPGARVLLQRLVNLELLGPFDVVAFVLHIDAGLRDVEFVQGLHGLELDITSAAQPGCDDVLRHLRVRPGGRAKGGFKLMTERAGPERVVVRGCEKMPPRDAQDGVVRFQLGEYPVGELRGRDREEQVRHP